MPKKRTEPWQAKVGTSALNPIQVMELQDAVRDRKDMVSLEGISFQLRYSDDGETVQYVPVKGWTPTGFLNIAKLLRSI